MKTLAQPRRIPGWQKVHEQAIPALGYEYGAYGKSLPVGVMESCQDFILEPSGRLAVRGGSVIKQTLTNGTAGRLSNVLAMERFSVVGAVQVGHRAADSKHYVSAYDIDLAALIWRSDLGWNTAAPARPRIAEMFEELYIADSTVLMANRQQLTNVDAAGTIHAVQADFTAADGMTLEAVKPFCHEVHQGVLFIAGQDTGVIDEPAMVRHSFLGVSPRSTSPLGFDYLAYNIIGSKGDRVTAMSSGGTEMLICKEHELYVLSGYGKAYGGWQYVVRQIANSDGLGVQWPRAVCSTPGGWWYGIGANGPFRTDGERIQLLVGPRLATSWRRVTHLDRAFARYLPDRHCVAFGVSYVDAFLGIPAPQDLWMFSLDTEEWVADWHLVMAVNDITILTGSATIAPVAIPGGITITHASATTSSITGSFTDTDSTAAAEVWYNDGTGYVLKTTLVAGRGSSAFTVSGLTATQHGMLKIRYNKGGTLSAYNAEADTYTLVAPPDISGISLSNFVRLTLVTDVSGMERITTKDGGAFLDENPAPVGDTRVDDSAVSSGNTYTYGTVHIRADWPAAIQTSAPATVDVLVE